MQTVHDPYRTRLTAASQPIERQEPVIHGNKSGPLSQAQLQQFDEDGFLFLPDMLEPHALAALQRALAEVCHDQQLKHLPEVVTEPQGDAVRSVFRVHELHSTMEKMTSDPAFVAIAEQILGSQVYIHQSRINDKPGIVGKGFNWHSDFETWHAEDGMPKMRALSVSVLLTDNEPFNGPLMLIPGSHKQFYPTLGETPKANWQTSLKAQQVGVPSPEHIRQAYQHGGIKMPTGKAGSVLIFDCNVLHASAENLSPLPRRNLFFVYNSINNKMNKPYGAETPRPDYLAERTPYPVSGRRQRSVLAI